MRSQKLLGTLVERHELSVVADNVQCGGIDCPQTILIFIFRRQGHALGRLVVLEDAFLQNTIKVKSRLIHDVGLHLPPLRFSDETGGHSFGADADRVDFYEWILLLELGDQPLRRLRFHGGVEDNPAFLFCAVEDRLGMAPAHNKNEPHETGNDDPGESAAHVHAPCRIPKRFSRERQRISTDGRGRST